MPITKKASQQIEAIAMDALTPVINQERFDVVVKMAEGFHALAEKGYPGAREFLNELFDLLGEHFHTDFKQDDKELLQLQSILLRSLKNKEFYQKKFEQFTNSAAIDLNKLDTSKPDMEETEKNLAERETKTSAPGIKKVKILKKEETKIELEIKGLRAKISVLPVM